MRSFLLTLAVVLGLMVVPAHHSATFVTAGATVEAAAAPAAAFDQTPAPQINVEVNRDGRWYASPVWIAIGVLALIVVILLIVMASKGGGTTIVRP